MSNEGYPSWKECKLIAKTHSRHTWERSQICYKITTETFPNPAHVPWAHSGYKITTGPSSSNFRHLGTHFSSVQSLSCVRLCDPMDCSTPGLLIHHQLPGFTQTHVRWVGDAIQPSHLLLSPSPAFNLSQHQGLFQWVSSSHQVAKVLEFQLQHQPFQWIFRTDFL